MIEIKCTQDDMARIINCCLKSEVCPLPPKVRCKRGQDCKTCMGENIDWNIVEESEDN